MGIYTAESASSGGSMGMSTDSANPVSRLLTEAEKLGKSRDGILVLIGIIYFLGYISWANYAQVHALGLLPALDAQYLAAGILPTIVLAAAGLLAMGIREYSRRTLNAPSARRRKFATIVVRIAGSVILVGFIAKALTRGRPQALAESLLYFGVCLGFIAGVSFASAKGDVADRFFRRYVIFMGWAIGIVLGPVLAFFLYANLVFPMIPSEFGGPAPRCTRLDVWVDQLAPETRYGVLPAGTASLDSSHAVRRTSNLSLVFQTGDFVLVELPTATRATSFLRIAKSSVVAMADCAATR
jgi:hypothetical protein